MRTLLLALNAKYIHSNIAVRYLQKYAAPFLRQPPQILELTINNRLDFILDEIFRRSPDILLFSTYIWNVDMVRRLASEYRKLRPDALIGAGGPEVSYESEAFLRQNPAFGLIIRGEGEQTVRQLLSAAESGADWHVLPGLTVRTEHSVRVNPPQPALDLSGLPFPYEPDFCDAPEQIKYYESSRGCPFQCQYCLSSIEKGVRAAPLDKVFADLKVFLRARVRQVKFVDRTFNYDSRRALEIWRFLRDHDNGVTNFHFEITAELLTPETLDFFRTVRPELFQFEIGVQSTNPDTIREIRRTTDTERLLALCRQLDKPKNIHLHLDLIAGLPYEDLESFGRSFDTVMQIRPQQMQLGFLKVLKGSLMEQKAPEYGLEYSRRPPFTFIRTRWLDYPQLLQLKEMESVVEDYYNSGLFGNQIEWMISQEASPFSFFLDFGAWKVEHQLHLIPQGIAERCTTLWDYYFSRYPERAEQEGLLHDLCLFDLCLHTKPQKLPERVTTQANLPYREAIRALFRDEAQLRCLFGEENFLQHSRQAHLQVFSFDPQTRQPRLCAMLFDYHRRDLLGRAKVTDVSELIL